MAIQWVKLELDVMAFDSDPYAGLLNAIEADGIALSTLAELGPTERNLRRMFELNAECSADIPGRGPFHTWEAYQRLRIDVPSFTPAGVLIAHRELTDEWIGMAGISMHPERDYLFNEMTGVRRAERRRGLATAMKVRNLGFTEETGRSIVRTVHQPGNDAMIKLNRQLGYTNATWPYP